jgi:tetratricopeptide (TPR) repeat protein
MKLLYKYFTHYLLRVVIVVSLISCEKKTTDLTLKERTSTGHFDSIVSINPGEAQKITNETFRIAKLHNDDTLFLKAYYYQITLDANFGIPEKVIQNSEKGIEYANKVNNDYFKNKIYLVLAKYCVLHNDYSQGLNYYLKAKDYFERVNDLENLSTVFNGLGILYFELQDYQNCRLNFDKAFTIYNKLGDIRGKAIYYVNIGNIYMIKEDYLRAKEYQEKSLETFKSLNDTVSVISIMINISNIEANLKQYESAIKRLQTALSLSNKNNNKRLRERILLNFGIVYSNQNNFREANKYLSESRKLSDSIKFPRGKLDALEQLSENAEKENNYEHYASYTKQYYRLKDSISGSDVKQKIEELKWTNEFEKSKLEKSLLSSKYNLEKERNNYLIFSIVLTIVISILIIGFAWLFYRNNKKSLQISEFENDRLQEKINIDKITIEKEKADKELLKIKSVQQELELDSKNREITSISLQLITKNKLMTEISDVL